MGREDAMTESGTEATGTEVTEATAATDADMAAAATVATELAMDMVAAMAVMELDMESAMDMVAAMVDMESFINLNNTLIKLYGLSMQTDRIFIKYCKIVYQL